MDKSLSPFYNPALRLHIPVGGNYFQTLQECKKYYDNNIERITAYHTRGGLGIHHPYPCDWSKILTPIEFHAWLAIRCKGNIPLYPQFPVGKYFVDFANPYYKIGLELDGKEFHDRNKDIQRDTELYSMGWKIFRITGSEMMRSKFIDWYDSQYEVQDEDNYMVNLENWLTNTGDGVIECLKIYYFKGLGNVPTHLSTWLADTVFRSLIKHNLIRDEI